MQQTTDLSKPAFRPGSGRLESVLAIVTGATGGIGRATCRRLAAEGATVLVTDLDKGRCEAVAAELKGSGGTALAHALDVTDEKQWAAVADRAGSLRSEVEVLVNNAGVGQFTTIETETPESWDEVIAVNQRGVWLGMQALGPRMAKRGKGSIVNISSIWGTFGGFGTHFSYHASKGAVRTMSKSAAVHWGPDGVRVNSLHPGFIETEASRNLWRNHPRREKMLERTPLGRFGKEEEIAAAVAFLVSDDATFVTGSELYVDGGFSGR